MDDQAKPSHANASWEGGIINNETVHRLPAVGL